MRTVGGNGKQMVLRRAALITGEVGPMLPVSIRAAARDGLSLLPCATTTTSLHQKGTRNEPTEVLLYSAVARCPSRACPDRTALSPWGDPRGAGQRLSRPLLARFGHAEQRFFPPQGGPCRHLGQTHVGTRSAADAGMLSAPPVPWHASVSRVHTTGTSDRGGTFVFHRWTERRGST